MPCSICKKVGHNYKTCPDISQEERERLIQDNKKKKEDARKRKEERRKNEISWVKMEVSNLNEYDIVVYYGFKWFRGGAVSGSARGPPRSERLVGRAGLRAGKSRPAVSADADADGAAVVHSRRGEPGDAGLGAGHAAGRAGQARAGR